MCYRNYLKYSCNHERLDYARSSTICVTGPITTPNNWLPCPNPGGKRVVGTRTYKCRGCDPRGYNPTTFEWRKGTEEDRKDDVPH